MKPIRLIAVLLAGVVFATFNMFLHIKIAFYTIRTKKVKKKIRVAFISDLHSCYYGKNQTELTDLVKCHKPDIILFGGDIVDDKLPEKNALKVLKTLAKDYPCYYVSGNHEYRSERIDEIKNKITDLGVTVLEGDCRKVNLNGNTINICGCDDFNSGRRNVINQLYNIYRKKDNNYYSILISHRPEHINQYVKYNFDLVLSGHAHGGQWRLPGVINGLYSPGQGLFPKYAGGRYVVNGTDFIVSRGLSREKKLVPRIFNNPELVVIDIK